MSANATDRTSFLDVVTPADATPAVGDVTREYVSGGAWDLSPTIRHLQDIAEGIFGEISFERLHQMAVDPAVSSAIDYVIEGALGEGYQFIPAVPETDPDYELAVEIAQAALRAVERPSFSLLELLKEMLRPALIGGCKIAEKSYELVSDPSSPDNGRYVFLRIAAKPPENVRFVVDPFWNVIAIYAKSLITDEDGKTVRAWRYWNPRMFCWLTLRKEDEDPRGRSSLRGAYPWWYLKTQVPRQFHRWIVQCALPIFLGFVSPNEGMTTTKQASGEKAGATKQEAMVKALEKLQSMMCAAFPNGSDVKVVEMQEKGEQFANAVDICDKQITKAILWQELATRDADHQTKGSTGEQMTIVDLLIASIREVCAAMAKRQIFHDWVVLNWGDSAAARLTPEITFGDAERRNFETTLNAVNNAWGKGAGVLRFAKMQDIYETIGFELAEDWEELWNKMRESILNPPVQPGAPGAEDNAARPGANPGGNGGDPRPSDNGTRNADELAPAGRVRSMGAFVSRFWKPKARVLGRRR